jgi:outer membrane receptor protein involved in Fe transport
MRYYMRFMFIALAIVWVVTEAGPAFAQELEEVVVTAQLREETLAEVPISIVAVSGEQIENRGIDSFQALSQSMPNVFINENQIDSTISIRGVTTGNNKGFEQSVSMYFDGISYGRSQLIRTPLVDLERVEVLRGPQPTLFGKNAIAGAVNVISAKPTDDFEGKISLSNEFEHDERQFLGVLSGPLTGNLTGRLTASYREIDGWIENTQLNRKEVQREESYVRGQLAWSNEGSLDVNLKVERAEFDSLGYAMENLNPQDGYTLVFAGPIAVDVVEDWKRASGEVSSDNEMTNAVLTADWNWGDHTLTSITGWVDYDTHEILDVDYTNLLILDDTNQTENYSQFSQELRLTSPGGERFDYIAGLFYQTADVDVYDNVFLGPFLTLAGPPVALLNDSNWAREFTQSSDLWSVFAQGDIELGDRFDLTVGARFSSEDKSGSRSLRIVAGPTNVADQLPAPVPIYPNLLEFLWAAVLNVGPHDISGKRSEDSFDPLVRLMFRATDHVSLYASYTEGSKAGGFDVRGNSAPGQIGIRVPGTWEYDGEDAETFEVGAKMSWDRAQVNLSLFYTDYTNLQTNIFDGVLGFLVQNASSAEVKGIEADGRFLLTENLELYAAAAYNDYEYTDFAQSQCAYKEPPTTVVEGRAYCDRSGFTAPYAPEFTANLGVDWSRQLTDNLRLDFNFNLDHSSDYFLTTNLDPLLQESGYTKLGAVVGISGREGKWRLSLIGDNLTDERIRVIGGTLPLARTFVQLASGGALDGTAYDAIYARPRNITLKFEYLF